jgi:tRNA threonylcarbamoyladenosine biosynthesis protein TsaB
MALILSIDTSTMVSSVALHQDDKLLVLSELMMGKSHSGMLTTLIDNMVKYAGFTLADLDAIAIAKGPGSYTGLRIGASTAKGLCFALDKPLIAINTLEAMATQVSNFFSENQLLCPMIDARRMEVYSLISDTNSLIIRETMAEIIDENSFAEILAEKSIVFFGDGAAKCKTKLNHENAIFPNISIEPSAKTVGILASKAYMNQAFENIVTFEPFYLKDFVGTQPRKV